jgi:Trichohyalin-plectin-homology domain
MPSRITAQVVEKNIRAQREVEAQRRQLNLFADENSRLVNAANAVTKIEGRRRQMHMQACQTEAAFEEKLRQEEYARRQKERLVVQNDVLASELDKQAAEDERRVREIQRICNEAPELRELERALKIAYLNRERALQHEEKILLAIKEQERIQAIEDQMEYDRQRAIKADASKLGAKRAIYEEQRTVIQRQIAEKREELALMMRQKEKDRETVDEIVARINAEDYADAMKRKQMQEATAKMMRDYAEQRRKEIADAKAAAKAEEDAIAAYNQSVAARSEGVAAQKQAKKDEDDRKLRLIVEETERKRREEEEFNSLRDMLWEEELEAARARDVQQRQEKQLAMKREMMEANARMLVFKEEQRKKDIEQESRMVSLMKQKFAEDEARERAAEDRRREAKMRHMELIALQKQQRKSMYDQERIQELEAQEDALRREEYRQQVIREARARLLQEHASKLKGYLPPGVFSNASEFEEFANSAAEEY